MTHVHLSGYAVESEVSFTGSGYFQPQGVCRSARYQVCSCAKGFSSSPHQTADSVSLAVDVALPAPGANGGRAWAQQTVSLKSCLQDESQPPCPPRRRSEFDWWPLWTDERSQWVATPPHCKARRPRRFAMVTTWRERLLTPPPQASRTLQLSAEMPRECGVRRDRHQKESSSQHNVC